MIDSEPSASQPRNSRVPARRSKAYRQKPVARPVYSASTRWKVQLELAPAEIALVYRQGLARGAEVRRHGTQEWRPLVTTPELRAALSARAGLPVATLAASVSTLRDAPPSRIGDASLAALAPVRLPNAPLLPSLPPPPPPIGKSASQPPPAFPGPARLGFSNAVESPALPRAPIANSDSELPVLSFTPAAAHARPAELSFVAVAAVAATLIVMLLVQRVSHWGEVRAAIDVGSSSAHARAALPSPAPAPAASPVSNPSSEIPVIAIHDLPVERGLMGALPAPRRGASPSSTLDRAAFAGAMGRAAAAARSCGAGPVQTRVVATFAPSGVPNAVHFAASPPPASLRGCILSAVARARVSPFDGEPVTVSKNISW